MRLCKVKDCSNKHYAKGYCNKHYKQMIKHGKIINTNRSKRDPNEIIECETYAEIVLYNEQCEEVGRALVDLDVIDSIKDIKLSLNRYGYAYNSRIGFLHRYIWILKFGAIPKGISVDHINHCTLDNRVNNLRLVTLQQNQFNREKKNNHSSKYMNVSWDKKLCKWKVGLKVNGKAKYGGCFDSELEASIKADEMRLLYFGLYASLNHSIENYTEYILSLGLDLSEKH